VAEHYLRQSPLAHLGLDGRAQGTRGDAGVTMSEQPFRGIANLRMEPNDKEAMTAIETALGFALPVEPNTTAASDTALALWLGPNEWWIVTPGPDPACGPDMAAKLRTALADYRGTVTDVSDSRTCVRIGGPRARDLLCKGMPLDLHPRAFAVGHCAQSVLSKTGIVVHLVADDGSPDGLTFELYVLRSFAEYLWLWLEDAAREYDLTIISS
jgi:sarcosine oxidase, subunit gamma